MQHADPLVRALQDWIGVVMRRSMRSILLFLKENELSMSQVGALFQINHGSSNVSDIGEGLGISIAASSQMLERLVQQGLVLRLEDPQDRRVKQLGLTEKGRRIVRASVHARLGWLQAMVADLTERERDQVAGAIRLLSQKAEQFEADAKLAR